MPPEEEIRAEECACGGVLLATIPHDWEQIAETVRAHNETVGHRLWRKRGGLDNQPRAIDWADAYEGRLLA